MQRLKYLVIILVYKHLNLNTKPIKPQISRKYTGIFPYFFTHAVRVFKDKFL